MTKPEETVFYVHRGNRAFRAFKLGDNGDLISYGVSLSVEEIEDFREWFNEQYPNDNGGHDA